MGISVQALTKNFLIFIQFSNLPTRL